MRPSTKEEIQAAVAKLTRQGLVSVRPPDARNVNTLVKIAHEARKKQKEIREAVLDANRPRYVVGKDYLKTHSMTLSAPAPSPALTEPSGQGGVRITKSE